MHPAHEMVEMLAPGRQLQALVELIHQPGLAAPHRPPQVNAIHPPAPLQRLEALLQSLHGVPLCRVGGEPALFKGVVVSSHG
ncbi:hypothetical protein D3C76_1583330 [compost metagenome]